MKKNIGEIMSSKVSNILNGHIDSTSFSEDMVCRAFISNYLGEKKLQEWEQLIIKMIILDGIAEEKSVLISGTSSARILMLQRHYQKSWISSSA